jgi:hypothetical protein
VAWIELTEEDLLTAVSGPELGAIRAAALRSAQADPVQPTIDQVTDLVRGYVGGCSRNLPLGDVGIPQKLVSAAIDLIAVRMSNRVNLAIKPGRQKAHDDAMELLKTVARCDFAIEEAETVSTEKLSTPKASFSGRRRRFDRCDEEGI